MTPPPKPGEPFWLTRTLIRGMANEYRKMTKNQRIFLVIAALIYWAATGFDGV